MRGNPDSPSLDDGHRRRLPPLHYPRHIGLMLLAEERYRVNLISLFRSGVVGLDGRRIAATDVGDQACAARLHDHLVIIMINLFVNFT